MKFYFIQTKAVKSCHFMINLFNLIFTLQFYFFTCEIELQDEYVCTDGRNILHTLLVKHYNDYLDRQRCGVAWPGVCSYTCKLGTFFVMPLTLLIPIFEKISLHVLCNVRSLTGFSTTPSRDFFENRHG